MTATVPDQPDFISAMLDPAVYDHPVRSPELIETHISWVILTGDFAYKIKKPVDFGFLDFSTLEKRRFCCEEEVRLNRRLAPDIYLDVLPLTGATSQPVLGGSAEAFEYAVKMRQFAQQAQLDCMLAAGELGPDHLQAVARMVASFHMTAETAPADSDYGTPERVFYPVDENFRQIREQAASGDCEDRLTALEGWSRSTFERLRSAFVQRRAEGHIRECHGDMHLRNLAWYNDGPIAFDCLEFNPSLRWIDTISDLAFLVMDLQDRERPGMAQHVLNTYLEACGDYGSLAVLPFYLVYRALVRAKVDAIRAGQAGIAKDEQRAARDGFRGYLSLAESCMRSGSPRLIITRGLSASGKSTVTSALIEQPGMIRVRSDVERKRLHGALHRDTSTKTGETAIDAGIYTPESSERTYRRLAALASEVIEAGFTVIVDAAFLEYDRRQPFRQLALQLNVPYVILEMAAPEQVLRERIRSRPRGVSDADLAVLEHQLANRQSLHEEECPYALVIDTTGPLDIETLLRELDTMATETA